MSVGFTDWTELGAFPLQDHEEGVGVGVRMALMGGRVHIRPDPGSGGKSGVLEYARDGGLGTLGDVHPWLFWQTKDREKRRMGAWSMAWGALTVDGGNGGGRYYVRESKIQPLTIRDGRTNNNVPKTDVINDVRFRSKEPAWPDCFNTIPAGVYMVAVPSTEESRQREVMLHADPRLVAPNADGPGEAGTLVVDCQPNGELCMDGSTTPGKDGRAARLQSVFRVIPLNANSTGPLGAAPYNAIAINYATASQDQIMGLGAVWIPMKGGGGTGGPTRPGNTTGPVRPGNTNVPIRPGGPPASSLTLGEDFSSGPGESEGGNTSSISATGGADDKPKSVCEFGKFRAVPKQGFGVGLMENTKGSGPIHGGAGHDDKHRITTDRDGNPITSTHISTNAYFYRDQKYDAPLLFEGDWPPDVKNFPLKSFVHLSYDAGLSHAFVQGPRPGMWRWWAEVPDMTPTKVPVPTVDTPRTPGPTTPGPTTPGPTTPGPTTPGPTTPGPTTPIRPGGSRPGVPPPRGPIRPGPGPGRSWPIRPGGGYGPPTGGLSGPTRPGGAPGAPSGGERERPPGVSRGPTRTGPPAPGAPQPGGPREPLIPPWVDEDQRYDKFRIGSGAVPELGSGLGGPGRGGTRRDQALDVGAPSPRDDEDTGVVPKVGNVISTRVGRYAYFRPIQSGFGSIAFRPQLWIEDVPHFEHNPNLPGTVLELEEFYRPTVLVARAWGGQTESGDFDYACPPLMTNVRGGSANGGILFSPPELTMEDYLLDAGGDTASPKTQSFIAAAPGVAFAVGTPSTDGSMVDGAGYLQAATAGFELGEVSSGSLENLINGQLVGSEKFVSIAGENGVRIPYGTTAQRSTIPINGELRVNSTTGELEFYDGGWVSAGGGGSSTFLGLSDTPGSFTANKIPHVNSGATALAFSGPAINSSGQIDGGAAKAVNFAGAAVLGDLVEIVQAVAVFFPFSGGTITGTTTFNSSAAVLHQANVDHDDNVKARFGTGDDAEIYYDGTDLFIVPDAVGSGRVRIGSHVELDDNDRIYFGTGQDASIHYDAADLCIDPNLVGSGAVKVAGDIEATGEARLEAEATIGGSASPDADASLDLVATDKGLLLNRVADPAATIGSTTAGLLCFDSDTGELKYCDGSSWLTLATV